MLNADRLFQTLHTGIVTEVDPDLDGDNVGADLDLDSFDRVPFVTHRSLAAADRNNPSLYSVTHTVSLFLDVAETGFAFVERYHAQIMRWDSAEMTGIVPGVGAVEEIGRELAAFDRLTGGVEMLNKSVTQYVGQWELTVRKL